MILNHSQRNLRVLLAAMISGIAMTGTAALGTEVIDFSGHTAGIADWEVPCRACDAGILKVGFNTTMIGDFSKWSTQLLEFTHPEFSRKYGPSTTTLSVLQLDPAPLPGSQTEVTFDFGRPLGSDSQLLLLDVDALGEQVTIRSNTGPVAEPTYEETALDAMSIFGDWDASSQTLTGSGIGNNNKEANIADISGASKVTLTYRSSTPAVANVMIRATPEPTSAFLLVCSLLTLGLIRPR